MVEYEHVRAIVRLRPPHAHGAHRKGKKTKPLEEVVARVQGDAAITVQVSPTTHQIFNCDCALGPEDGQAATFERSGVQHLLEQAMQGYRCTVFAYGPTGAGKTHTIVGGEDGESEGLLPRSVDYFFERFGQIGTHAFRVKLSCLEIYKEMVTDMLVPARDRTPLTVREHAEYGFFVEGLRIRLCAEKAALMDAADAALRSRKVGSHSLNARSNRSHLMLTVFIEARPRSSGGGAATYGSICFVDLAGSERLKETGSTGEMLAEAQAINKSLYVLAKVIRGLNAGRPADYRESKLTKLLWASLGGNCKTLMIACASPSASGVAEMLRTLKFAIGVKGITNHPTVVLNPQNQIIKELQKEIVRLRMENARLRESLDTAGSDSGGASHTPHTVTECTTPPARGRDWKRKNGCRKSRGGRNQEYVGSEGERKGSAGTPQAVVAAAQRGDPHGGGRAPESQCSDRDRQPGSFTTINQGSIAAESDSRPCRRSSAADNHSRQVATDDVPAARSQLTRQRATAPTDSPAESLGADCSSEHSEYSVGCTVSTTIIMGSNPSAADDATSEPSINCEQRTEVQKAQVGQKTSEQHGSGRPNIEVTAAQPASARAAVAMPSSPKAALMETSAPLSRDGEESTQRKRRSSLSDIIESTRDEAVSPPSPSVQTAAKKYTRAGVTFIPIANEEQFDVPEGSGFQLEFTLKPLTPDSRGSDGHGGSRGTDASGNGRLHGDIMSYGDGDESVERGRGGGSRGQRQDDECSLTSDGAVASVYQRQYQELAGRILMQQQQPQHRSHRHQQPRWKEQELTDDSTYRVGELRVDPVDRRTQEKAKIVERSARRVANGRVLPHLRHFEDYRGEKEAVRRLVNEWERQPRGLGKSTERSFVF